METSQNLPPRNMTPRHILMKEESRLKYFRKNAIFKDLKTTERHSFGEAIVTINAIPFKKGKVDPIWPAFL